MEYKQVRANQKGFYDNRLIQEDEVFLVPVGQEALWFDDVETPEKPKSAGRSSATAKQPE